MVELSTVKNLSEQFTVLYVEDNQEIREVLGELFQHLFKTVDFAENGRQGYERFLECQPDIVITDIVMPEMDGLSMLRKIKTERSNQKTLITSASNEIQHLFSAIELGVDGFLLKPISMNQALMPIYKICQVLQLEREVQKKHEDLEKLVNQRTEELQQSNREFRRLFVTDTLTDLPNKQKLRMELQNPTPIHLLLLNLNNLSHINQVYGHEAGDRVLVAASEFLSDLVEEPFRLFKLDSDEFVILDSRETPDFCAQLATSIKERTAAHSINITEFSETPLSFTITVASGQGEEVLNRAKIALEEAKKLGKNRIVHYHDNMQTKLEQQNNLYWINVVRQSLKTERFIPFYQPIVNNVTKKIEKNEVLARIRQEDEYISPGKFILPSKLAGSITEITRQITSKALHDLSHLPFTAHITLNITKEDLEEEYLPDFFHSLRQMFTFEYSQITLEILENISIIESTVITDQLKKLKSMGFLMAIDDFGSEHSSFSRLLDLEIDYIKIDGVFVKDIHLNEKNYKIVKAIKNLADSFEITAIAEFVHCQEVYDKVCEIGIPYSQGYFFSPPCPTLAQDSKENVS